MISIVNTPDAGSTAQDDLWHVVSSTNSTTSEFKYVFDVWINGVQKIRVRQFADPLTNSGYFNASNVVKNSFSYEWFVPSSVNNFPFISAQPSGGQVYIDYDVRYYEQMSGVMSAIQASGTTRAYNFMAPVFNRRNVTIASKANKWLTNRPNYADSFEDNIIYLPVYLTATKNLNVKTYNGSNNLIQTFTQSFSSGFTQLNISQPALNIKFGIDFSSVKFYTIDIAGQEVFKVNIQCAGRYDVKNIHFLNSWGMYESKAFDLVSKMTMNVQRKGFEQADYRMTATAVNYKNDTTYYESGINYFNKGEYKYNLTSNALTDEEYNWISDLILSPQILLQEGTSFYPVTLTNSSYTFNKYVNDKQKVLQLEFDLNISRNSQLR